ncbi:hypothetical protein TNCV_6211 [Trichonephila clavipes]|nr:hypothetical protein TNCV_6211 [Trichonephila clavipes]
MDCCFASRTKEVTRTESTCVTLLRDRLLYSVPYRISVGFQINLEVDRDDVQKLLDSHNQEVTIDELLEMHEQEQDIEELESFESAQSEDRMTVGNLIESLS